MSLTDRKQRLSAEKARAILRRITDDDARLLGLNPRFARPEWLILTTLAVPPPHVRPSVAHDALTRGEDDVTHKLSDIVKANMAVSAALRGGQTQVHIEQVCTVHRGWGGEGCGPLPALSPRVLAAHCAAAVPLRHSHRQPAARHPLRDAAREHQAAQGLPGAARWQGRPRPGEPHGEASRLQRAHGHHGRPDPVHAPGKGPAGGAVEWPFRTPASPPTHPLTSLPHQVGVPRSIAANLTVPERVSRYNIRRLQARRQSSVGLVDCLPAHPLLLPRSLPQELVDRGPDQHPGAKSVIRDGDLRVDLRYKRAPIVLREGWVVERHLMDDDTVLFNRQVRVLLAWLSRRPNTRPAAAQPTLHKMSIMCHRVKVLDYSTFRMNL